jgi:hypothetical protein
MNLEVLLLLRCLFVTSFNILLLIYMYDNWTIGIFGSSRKTPWVTLWQRCLTRSLGY